MYSHLDCLWLTVLCAGSTQRELKSLVNDDHISASEGKWLVIMHYKPLNIACYKYLSWPLPCNWHPHLELKFNQSVDWSKPTLPTGRLPSLHNKLPLNNTSYTREHPWNYREIWNALFAQIHLLKRGNSQQLWKHGVGGGRWWRLQVVCGTKNQQETSPL